MASPTPLRYLIIDRAVRRASPGLSLWTSLSMELNKIIGTRGFESLFLRSLRRAQVEHPWLAADARTDDDLLIALGTSLDQRNRVEADAANATLLTIFADTLIVLIGELITERILCAAWGEDLSNDIEPEQQA